MILAFDLQIFAAEDEGRTIEPTVHKIRRARREGRVARSMEVGPSFSLLVVIILLAFIGGSFLSSLQAYLSTMIRAAFNLKTEATVNVFSESVKFLFAVVAPIMLAALIAELLVNLLQTEFLFTTRPLRIDFSRINLNIIQALKRIFLSRQALVNFLKSVLKLAIVGIAAFTVLYLRLPQVMELSGLSPSGIVAKASSMVFELVIKTAIVWFVLSILDYMYQRYEFRQSLKMTPREWREEWKQYEGDPYIKARIREMMREIASVRLEREVPQATVVITNPIHIACALRYRHGIDDAPTMVAKGAGVIAERIKEIAREHDIPIVEDPPLARQLFYMVDVGETIPPELYEAVVRVLVYVYQTQKEKARFLEVR